MPQVTTYTSVGFDLETRDRVIVEYDTAFLFNNGIPLRVFPSNPDLVTVSVGTIQENGVREINRYGEILRYQRSSEAQPKYPGISAFTLKSTTLYDDAATLINNPRIAYNSQIDTFFVRDTLDKQPVSATGGITIDYTTLYRSYNYFAEHRYLSNTTGVSILYGYVLAIKGAAVATLEIRPPSFDTLDAIELYRVYSEIVADSDGAWEKPPNFPTDRIFPGAVGDIGNPDTSQYFIDRRVHEVGYLRRSGQILYETPRPGQFSGVWLEEPYATSFNAPSTIPAYIFESAINEQTAPPEFSNAFRRVRWNEIKAAVQSRWPGVVI